MVPPYPFAVKQRFLTCLCPHHWPDRRENRRQLFVKEKLMKYIAVILIAASVLNAFFMWCICSVGGKADREEEEEMRKRANQGEAEKNE